MKFISENQIYCWRYLKFLIASLLILMPMFLSAIIEVDIPTVSANTNESIEVPLTLTGIESSGIFSIYMEIYFEPSIVDLRNVSTEGCITESWGDPFFNTLGDSILSVAIFGSTYLSGEGDLIKINFDIISQYNAVSPLNFINFLFNEGNPDVELSNGEIIITDRFPEIEQSDDVIAEEGDLIDFYVTAIDPLNLDLAMEALDLPENASFIDDGFGNGHFQWQTSQISAGEYLVGFSATNTESFSDTAYVNILIENVLNVWLPEIDTPVVSDINIPIFTDELVELNIYSFFTKITFNPLVIAPTNISTIGTVSEGWGTLSYNLNNTGEILISMFATEELSGNGHLIDLEFDVIGSDGSFSDLDFDFFVFNDGTPDAEITDGIIYIGTPVAEFMVNVIEGFSPLVVNFTDLSIAGPNAIAQWEWNFGDEETSNQQNPTHTFFESGVYTVSLTVTNTENSSNTETKIEYIKVLPIEANFTANQTSGYYPAFEVDFSDLSIGNITNWYWDFQNDGSYDSFQQNPNFTYTNAGNYSVKLLVSDGTNFSTFVRDNFITVSYVPPKAPENVHIEVINNNAVISWSEVAMSILETPVSVEFYLVYASTDPFGDFMYIGYTDDTYFRHPGVPIFVDQMFYKVKAYFGTRESLQRFIQEETWSLE